jgi:hypothetical protein
MYTYIHAYTYAHFTKQTYVSGISLVLSVCERKGDRKSFANGKLKIFRSLFCRIGSHGSHRLPLSPPYTCTHTRRLTAEFVSSASAPFDAASAGPETEPDHRIELDLSRF